MQIKAYNLLNVGVGGQGVIRAIQILSWAALHEGFKVRTAETHGMAQRGGSVASYLRFGTDVEGPLIPRGATNVILAFEASEAVRNFNYAGPQTNFIINDKLIIPPMIHQQGLEYPSISEIRKFLSDVSKNIYFIPADDLASKAGNQRTMNVVMLGVLVGMHQIPIANDTIFNSIMKFIPKKTIKVNKIAFDLGIERGNEIRGQNNE